MADFLRQFLAVDVVDSQTQMHKNVLAKLFVRDWALAHSNRCLPFTQDGLRWCFWSEPDSDETVGRP